MPVPYAGRPRGTISGTDVAGICMISKRRAELPTKDAPGIPRVAAHASERGVISGERRARFPQLQHRGRYSSSRGVSETREVSNRLPSSLPSPPLSPSPRRRFGKIADSHLSRVARRTILAKSKARSRILLPRGARLINRIKSVKSILRS